MSGGRMSFRSSNVFFWTLESYSDKYIYDKFDLCPVAQLIETTSAWMCFSLCSMFCVCSWTLFSAVLLSVISIFVFFFFTFLDYVTIIQILRPWPFYFFLLLGICPVNRNSIDYLLTHNGTGNAVIIVVGGAAESLQCTPGINTVTLRNRKGFVKLALQTGWAARRTTESVLS